MAAQVSTNGGRGGLPWRVLGWGGAVALLLVPLIGRFPWSSGDFVLAGVMLGGAGLMLELVARISADPYYRAGAVTSIAAAMLLFLVNGAVGFLGSEDNPANLMFLGVIGIAVFGAIFSGFKASGMAVSMLAAAIAQLLAGVVGYAGGMGSPGDAGVYEAVMGTTLFTGLWLLAAGLFRKAAA